MSVADCAALVERADPDRFLATMSVPVPARAILFPLYAFNVEVTRAPWVSNEPMICEMRLQWWLDALREIGAGQPPRAHEVVVPLAETARAHPLPLAPLEALVEARRWDIHGERFAGVEALGDYIEATGAGLTWAAARALGAPGDTERAVRDAGWAAGLAGYLRAVPELVAKGHHPLPDDRDEVIAALARAGLDRLARARRAGAPRVAVPALRAGWRAQSTLSRALAAPEAVREGRLLESDFARRAGLLRRALTGGW